MGLFITLKKLVSLGWLIGNSGPSLVEFAVYDYQPTSSDAAFLACWGKLQGYLHGADIPDAALTGLQAFLASVDDAESARVCLSLNCDVSFDVTGGTLCMDSHDHDVACCDSRCMREELAAMVDAYEDRYQ